MKFKFNLNETFFDDDFDVVKTGPVSSSTSDLDDEFVDYEDEHSLENVLPGPEGGVSNGIASELISLINDEWEAIEGYNNAITTLNEYTGQDPFYGDAIKVLQEIVSEENKHVGQLQEVLRHISPNAVEIDNGKREAKSQLGLVGGKLPVQSWDTFKNNASENTIPNSNEEICSLCDIDDEM